MLLYTKKRDCGGDCGGDCGCSGGDALPMPAQMMPTPYVASPGAAAKAQQALQMMRSDPRLLRQFGPVAVSIATRQPIPARDLSKFQKISKQMSVSQGSRNAYIIWNALGGGEMMDEYREDASCPRGEHPVKRGGRIHCRENKGRRNPSIFNNSAIRKGVASGLALTAVGAIPASMLIARDIASREKGFKDNARKNVIKGRESSPKDKNPSPKQNPPSNLADTLNNASENDKRNLGINNKPSEAQRRQEEKQARQRHEEKASNMATVAELMTFRPKGFSSRNQDRLSQAAGRARIARGQLSSQSKEPRSFLKAVEKDLEQDIEAKQESLNIRRKREQKLRNALAARRERKRKRRDSFSIFTPAIMCPSRNDGCSGVPRAQKIAIKISEREQAEKERRRRARQRRDSLVCQLLQP